FVAFYSSALHRDLYSFPTRRSSDLAKEVETLERLNRLPNTLPSIGLKMKTGLTVDFRNREALRDHAEATAVPLFYSQHIKNGKVDRKSTRLNSSHVSISYAVFCLKK